MNNSKIRLRLYPRLDCFPTNLLLCQNDIIKKRSGTNKELCNENKVENAMLGLFYCPYYQEDRNIAFDFIAKTENLNLQDGDQTKNLKEVLLRVL